MHNAISGGPDDSPQTEHTLLRLHERWNFFREKLLQRMAPTFAEYLTLPDEFAWACYQPAVQCCTQPTVVREPPLTFLGSSGSPYALPRGVAYDAEVWPSEFADRPTLMFEPLSLDPWVGSAREG